jgi:hypothetical protein
MNIHPALVQSALRSDGDARNDIKLEQTKIDEIAKETKEILEQVPAEVDAMNRQFAIDSNELETVVVPVLDVDEISQIRSVFLSTQAACVRIREIRSNLKQCAPVVLSTLKYVRQVMHTKRHKFLMYLFDGKGAYLKDDVTIYDISGLFEPEEYHHADSLLVSTQRATVKHAAISTEQRYPGFMAFTQDFDRLIDLAWDVVTAHH